MKSFKDLYLSISEGSVELKPSEFHAVRNGNKTIEQIAAEKKKLVGTVRGEINLHADHWSKGEDHYNKTFKEEAEEYFNTVKEEVVDEATGDKPFDNMMRAIKKGTAKQATADRKEQRKQSQQQARDAFGSMFGGGNPADKLGIRKQGMKEEVEQIDELSKGTLASYAKKATHDSRIKMGIGKDFERVGTTYRKPENKAAAKSFEDKYKTNARKREAGVGKAIDRLAKEEVEQIDEISADTARSYLESSEYKSRHAHKQEQDKAYNDYRTKHATSSLALMTRAEFAKDQRERAAKKKQVVAEVSQQTLQSYRKKAAKQKSDALDVTDRPDTDDATWVKNINIASKRKDGIAAANKRLGVAEGSLNEAETPNLPGKATHLTNKDVRHPEHGIISGSTTLRHLGGDNYEVRAGLAKGKTVSLDKQHVQKMTEETQQGDTMSMMEKYTAAIEGKKDFRSNQEEADKKQTPPFDGGTVTKPAKQNSDGTTQNPMSRARELAKQAMKKKMKEEFDIDMSEEQVDSILECMDEEVDEMFADQGSGSTRLSSRGEKRIATTVGKALAKNRTPEELKAKAAANAAVDARMAAARLAKEEVEQTQEQTHPKTAKEKDLAKMAPPYDKITHADVMVGRGVKKEELSSKEKMKKGLYNKEESKVNEAMISYSDFVGKMKAHKAAGNKIVDDKYTDKKAEYTSIDSDGVGRKVIHTHTGQKMENLGQVEKRDDKETTTEKRGRGRPAGSKSGARN